MKDKLRAERRAGELLGAMDLKTGNPQWSHDATKATLTDIGITKAQSSRWQKIAAMNDAGDGEASPRRGREEVD